MGGTNILFWIYETINYILKKFSPAFALCNVESGGESGPVVGAGGTRGWRRGHVVSKEATGDGGVGERQPACLGPPRMCCLRWCDSNPGDVAVRSDCWQRPHHDKDSIARDAREPFLWFRFDNHHPSHAPQSSVSSLVSLTLLTPHLWDPLPWRN